MEIQELVREFNAVTARYKEKAKAYELAIAEDTQRRREIAYLLVENANGLRRRTYKEVGEILGLSAGRVSQLVNEHSKHTSSSTDTGTGWPESHAELPAEAPDAA